MTTIQKTTQSVTFAVGEKAWWVTPSGYKETVMVAGRGLIGNTVIIQTMYGQRIKFTERNGRFVGVEYWGHLAKKPTVVAHTPPAEASIWTRIKSYFQ